MLQPFKKVIFHLNLNIVKLRSRSAGGQEGQSQVRFSSETWLVGWYDSSMVRGGWDFKVDFKVVNKWTSGIISGNLKLLI